jgi:serine protease Do
MAVPAGAEKRVPESREQVQFSYAPLVKKTAPAVVNVYTRRVVRTAARRSPLFRDPFFERFFGKGFGFGVPRERVQRSLGSGVVVRSDGIIVTNYHVIKGAQEITVALADRREFEAEVVLADERSDIAVLRIETGGEDLPVLDLADSDRLEVGDIVLAMGNPFGVGQTVTSGIVSAVARTRAGITDYQFFIQTDAAINPGNSGGPLIDIEGRLVGINTAIYSRTGGSHGIGFAIPANMVRSVLDGALGEGKVVRPWLGASGQAVTSEIAKSLDLDRPRGVLINNVFSGGPADDAGLKAGDVVLSVQGREVSNPEAMKFRIATRPVGETVGLSILRDGDERTLRVNMVPPPEVPLRDETVLEGAHPMNGVTVANLSPAVADELGMPFAATGVVVLKPASTRTQFSFAAKDVILAVSGLKTETVEDLVRALKKPSRGWEISVRRGGRIRTVRIIR